MSGNCIQYKSKNWNIQGLTRLREDGCYKKKRAGTSQKPGVYASSNFHDCTCEAPYTKELSLKQPAVRYRDGFGWTSMDGCNIDNDSKLRNARNLTNTNVIQQLFTRPYGTVPYMGRGSGNTNVESNLRPGEATMQKKQCNNLAGINIDRFTPQLPCIRQNVQNPKNIIPEDSETSWIRGGQPSRQIIRNKDYLKKCGFKYNGKYWKKK